MTMTMAESARRPLRTWHADGLSDMAIGGAMLVLSLMLLDGIYMLLFTQAHSSETQRYAHGSWINMAVTSALQLLVVVPFLVVEPLKRRFVYPRTGYMKVRVNSKARGVSFAAVLISGVVSLGFAMLVLKANPRSPDPIGLGHFWTVDMSVASLGIAIGAAFALNYLKYGFRRHLIVAAVSVAASLMLITVTADWQHKLLILSTVIGLSLIVSGAISFAQLLQLPILTAQEEEKAE